MNEENIAERGLGWKQVNREKIKARNQSLPPTTLARILRERKQDLLIFTSLGLTLVAACLAASPQAIDGREAGQSNNPKVSSTPDARESILTTDLIRIAEALLNEKGLNVNESSFKEQMAEAGFMVGNMERFGAAARTYIAGKDTKIRRFPTSREDWYPHVGTIDQGTPVGIIAELEVININTGLPERYGLMVNPFRETPIPATAENLSRIPKASNVIVQDGMIRQLEPGWVALSETRGSINWSSLSDQRIS